jgi:hypothetical protein
LAELDRAQRKKDHDATWKKGSNPYPLDMTDLLIEESLSHNSWNARGAAVKPCPAGQAARLRRFRCLVHPSTWSRPLADRPPRALLRP